MQNWRKRWGHHAKDAKAQRFFLYRYKRKRSIDAKSAKISAKSAKSYYDGGMGTEVSIIWMEAL